MSDLVEVREEGRDVNKDQKYKEKDLWNKDQDKDKDFSCKDQDKGKDFKLILKDNQGQWHIPGRGFLKNIVYCPLHNVF